jgi:hypothetical protein
MLGLIKSVRINKNLDKTATRGKKRVKTNTCDITLANVDHQLDNIMRMGRRIQVFFGYGSQVYRVGSYLLNNPVWKYPKSGVPSVSYKGTAGDVRLMLSKTARVYRAKTFNEVLADMASRSGMVLASTVVSAEKETFVKTAAESDWDALQRWSLDRGYEFWVDESTEPNTMHCGAFDIGDITIFGGGQKFSVGWGPNTQAYLPAQEMIIEHRYPVATGGGSAKIDKTKRNINVPVAGGPGRPAKVHRFEAGWDEEKSTTKPSSTKTTSVNVTVAGNASASASTLTKQVTAVFYPGVPIFKLGQRMPVVEMGDQSGLYTIMDITHEFGVGGFKTTVKAIKGGGVTSKKKPAETEGRLNVPTAGGKDRPAKVHHIATSFGAGK